MITLYWRFKLHAILKNSVQRHGWRTRYCEVTMNWNGDHVQGRHHHVHRVYSGQHTNATNFCLENVILLYWKMHCRKLFVINTSTSFPKCARPYFHSVANKGLISIMKTSSMINNLCSRFCCMSDFVICRGCCLSYYWNKSLAKFKTSSFLNGMW